MRTRVSDFKILEKRPWWQQSPKCVHVCKVAPVKEIWGFLGESSQASVWFQRKEKQLYSSRKLKAALTQRTNWILAGIEEVMLGGGAGCKGRPSTITPNTAPHGDSLKTLPFDCECGRPPTPLHTDLPGLGGEVSKSNVYINWNFLSLMWISSNKLGLYRRSQYYSISYKKYLI